jgi:Putative Ig domain
MSFASLARSALLCALAVTPFSFSSTVVAADSSRLPAISGTPATTATIPDIYSFQPTATQNVVSRIKFVIRNQPEWAQFDPNTGRLWGRPNRAGTYNDIVIRVINWYGYADLPPFSITASRVGAGAPPTISGHPAGSINVGMTYNFTPAAFDAEHHSLSFSIQNKPVWATFSTSTGALTGTPRAADIGTYAQIVISVSDGKESVSLPAFMVAVNQISTGNVTIDWIPPTENADGTALANLAGYHVHYGTSPSSLTQTVSIPNPGLTSYVVDNLQSGTWYFAMTSYTSSGTESPFSGVVSATIQ